MIYSTGRDWLGARHKAVALIGMSGVGKTRISQLLRDDGDWFHYSVDFRIGTRYLGEYIADDFKREAMKVPLLREMLRSDSIYIGSNLSFHNLAPLSHWLGKPGNAEAGGIPFEEYCRRQRLHRAAEAASMLDAGEFIERAGTLYGYPHFVCDTSGSICEVVDPADPEDRVLRGVSEAMLIVYIRGSEAHEDALKARFDRAPKPMYYREDFLRAQWSRYLAERGVEEDAVDPDDFIRFGFAQLLGHRRPLYQAIADNWGVTVEADDIAEVTTAAEFDTLVARALDARG
ncbi:ATPase [Oceanicella sp. SM1341]|uniref:ATPase n=1 Tax=Oceanicella sp. SM1341 TaxID=1548889 RepID=UPI000E4CDFEA|nr:ATPase [Oceanicella sp. SM1341]